MNFESPKPNTAPTPCSHRVATFSRCSLPLDADTGIVGAGVKIGGHSGVESWRRKALNGAMRTMKHILLSAALIAVLTAPAWGVKLRGNFSQEWTWRVYAVLTIVGLGRGWHTYSDQSDQTIS